MNPSQDFISDAEVYLQEKLLADSAFQGVTVLRNANGDIDSKIEEAVVGLSLFVIISIQGGPVPHIGEAENWNFTVLINENALLNRAAEGWNGKTARLLAQKFMLTARTTNVCDLTTAQEIAGEDGFVVWQIKGTIPVAFQQAT